MLRNPQRLFPEFLELLKKYNINENLVVFDDAIKEGYCVRKKYFRCLNGDWNNEELKISSVFNYLGVIFTPKLKFNKHIEKRNMQAKNAINTTWQNFIGKPEIN